MTQKPQTVRTTTGLVEKGLVTEERASELAEVAKRYTVAITPTMLERIDEEDPRDPVARQFVPTGAELSVLEEERADPIGDEPHTKVPGITHRYPDRLLLKPLHTCAVYCRFCFRREKVGRGEGMLRGEDLDAAIEYIATHQEVWEVILSGGDPLILSPRKLRSIVKPLDDIDHVGIIRIHTRVPIVDPGRITEELLDVFDVKTPVWIVVHTNHSQEIGADAEGALCRLAKRGIPLLSQSVLLRGVNDTPQALESLFRTLVRNRVKPYYLHQGDLAQGTKHFRTSIAEGQQLMRALRGNVSGLCQPTYVLDIPGGFGKVPIGPSYLTESGSGLSVEDPFGGRHAYPPTPKDVHPGNEPSEVS